MAMCSLELRENVHAVISFIRESMKAASILSVLVCEVNFYGVGVAIIEAPIVGVTSGIGGVILSRLISVSDVVVIF